MRTGSTVLHVVEAFGGGVADAIGSYLKATPEYEHRLLYATRPGIDVDESLFAGFSSIAPLPQGHLSRIAAIRAEVRRCPPDVLHAHSSFAGAYARFAVSTRRIPVVYSPHCFAFERQDLRGAIRTGYRMVEVLLARNTSAFAVCSPRERELAAALGGRAPVEVVVNIARDPHPRPDPATRPCGPAPVIAMTGRLAPQKGIATFARLARAAHESIPAARFVWIGGGDTSLAGPLVDAGVEVTGWLAPAEVEQHLAEADLYVHTAEWEGFPVGLLEAVALGVPALVLARPYATALAADMVADDAALADRVIRLATDARSRAELRAVNRIQFASHCVQSQRSQLLTAYEQARPA